MPSQHNGGGLSVARQGDTCIPGISLTIEQPLRNKRREMMTAPNKR